MPARMLLAVAAILVAWSKFAIARDLTVVARGETMATAINEVYAQPFTAATSVAVQVESWDGGIDLLRERLKTADNGWDIIQVDADELGTGCSDGLFEKIDWSAVGGKDHYQNAGSNDCGVGAAVVSTVLAWDKDKFQGTPTWADFWDVAKYPGKRGLSKNVRGNLEIALLADGVAPGDVYKTLATSEGVDRAFRKLDQLKPFLVWWQTDADAAKILGSGDVLMTSAPSGAIAAAMRAEPRNFGMQWAQALYEVQSWVIAKASPNLKLAQQLLYFAGTPAIEVRLLRAAGVSGLAKGVNEGLPADLAAISPGAPANIQNALRNDNGFWRDNMAKLRPRFETWLGVH